MSILKPNKEMREIAEFWLKALALLAGAFAGILFGVDALNRFNTERKILASLAGDTEMSIDGKTGSIFKSTDGREYCRISGQYQVTNIGEYGFYSDQVVLKLWEVPHLDTEIAGEELVSFAISSRLDNPDERFKAIPLDEQIVPVKESFAPKNNLQRSFTFIFPINRFGNPDKYRYDSYYLIDANARASLEPIGKEGKAAYCAQDKGVFGNLFALSGDPGVCFNENDLRHTSHTFYCKDPQPAQALPSTQGDDSNNTSS